MLALGPRRGPPAAGGRLGAPPAPSPPAPPAPPSPPTTAPSIPWPSSPVGKALLAGVFYAGLVWAGFWVAGQVQGLQGASRPRGRARASGGFEVFGGTGEEAPEPRAPRARKPRRKGAPKKKSVIAEYLAGSGEETPPEDIDMGEMIFRGGYWLRKEGDRWVPFKHPGYNF